MFDMFDFNKDGNLDSIEMTTAYAAYLHTTTEEETNADSEWDTDPDDDSFSEDCDL